MYSVRGNNTIQGDNAIQMNGSVIVMIIEILESEDSSKFIRFLEQNRFLVKTDIVKKNGMQFIELTVSECKIKRKPGPQAKISKKRIITLRARGFSYRAIAKELGCSHSYIQQVCDDDETFTKIMRLSDIIQNNNTIQK